MFLSLVMCLLLSGWFPALMWQARRRIALAALLYLAPVLVGWSAYAIDLLLGVH
jgi:hypothetical protein